MTQQILDRLIYQENEHFIFAIRGDGLLSPKDFGILPVRMSTACSRGYYMVYMYTSNLYLREMTVCSKEYPAIENFNQYRSAYELWNATIYTGFRSVNSFTGGLIIGRNLRRVAQKGEPLHLGHWLSLRTIIELKFKNGVIQEEVDRSGEIESEFHKTDPDFSKLGESLFSEEYDFMYPLTLVLGQ